MSSPLPVTTIAKFAPLRAWPLLFFLFLIFIGYAYLTAYVITTEMRGVFPLRSQFLILLLPIGWVGVVFLLRLWFAAVTQLLLHAGAALWIADGELIFLTRHYLSVDCNEIATVSETTYGALGAKGIVVCLRNGLTRVVPAGSLAEPSATIVLRLKEKLGYA